ncbi:MAG: cysteine--tRNA ligase [Halobacteriovoraceae bacterium]|nr:cysteine--tRNA ligase [Halobacteriovoraceae bacterium]MCB9094153.1 cysteine--tRNA ligase [Halobacteriovoraceae bacterium]
MALRFYNTLSGQKEKFEPVEDGVAKIYLCGPTVYDYLHIGNFRGPITFNLLRNWLEFSGYKVDFIYNYTDVDDKIIKRAQEENVEAVKISEKYIEEFEKDFNRLGLKKHEHNPKVTEYMPQIIQFVADLVEKKKAYVVDGEVFYSIDSFPGYGKLSKKNLDELEAGNRVEVDERKKNPFDFVLWKPSKENEPSWISPWGAGRPGWHIECSAMIQSIFGKKTFDIHGGGIDLIFPHHENEIAQGEGRIGQTYCKYWIHNNFINLSNQKMSKSLGNVVKARDFMNEYHPEVLKYLFLSAHYRSMLSVDKEKINQVIVALQRIYSALELAHDVVEKVAEKNEPEAGFKKVLDGLSNKIKKALDDDLNSAEFISLVFEAVRAYNALGFKNKKWNAVHAGNSQAFLNWMKVYGQMSALFQEKPKEMLNQLQEILIRERKIDVLEVEKLLKLRNQARDEKNWKEADKFRDELLDMGVEVHDGSERGWTVKV